MAEKTVQPKELVEFAERLLHASKVDETQARELAEMLVWCNAMGRPNQGVWRLPILCKRAAMGLINCPCEPSFEKKGQSLMIMDGDSGFGHYVAKVAMLKAIEIARETGVGVVGVYNSSWYGAGACYVRLAADAGMIGIAMSNSVSKVAPYGGVRPVFGTNPFSFAAPRKNGQSIIVDMATAASAGSTITMKSPERPERLPEGFVVDTEGHSITDPDKVAGGILLPFGGAKGYGLALMVEVLSGVITGAGVSHSVTSLHKDFENRGNSGHFMLAIDITRFMDIETYYRRLEQLLLAIKQSKGPNGEVLYPGELRWIELQRSDREGIALDSLTVKALTKLAAQTSVPTLW